MNKFKAGDVVVCRAWRHGVGPGWNKGMDKYVGREVTVHVYLDNKGKLYIKEDNKKWVWWEPWLTLAEPFEGNV